MVRIMEVRTCIGEFYLVLIFTGSALIMGIESDSLKLIKGKISLTLLSSSL